VAVRGTRAARGDAGDWVHERSVARRFGKLARRADYLVDQRHQRHGFKSRRRNLPREASAAAA
jgi:hypothetical protein